MLRAEFENCRFSDFYTRRCLNMLFSTVGGRRNMHVGCIGITIAHYGWPFGPGELLT